MNQNLDVRDCSKSNKRFDTQTKQIWIWVLESAVTTIESPRKDLSNELEPYFWRHSFLLGVKDMTPTAWRNM